jgi:post-segregation antitoxin (ccd killing protein)
MPGGVGRSLVRTVLVQRSKTSFSARACSQGQGEVAPSPVALARSAYGRIHMRMPRMQVYLPEDPYESLKARGLPASELLQNAVRAELKRQDLLAETDKSLTSLVAQVGRPTTAESKRAEALASRVARRAARKAG